MEITNPNSLSSVLRNPDMLVWVANFFHCPLSASPTKTKQHVPLKCCFHLLPNATTQMPTRKPQILNIITQQFFLKRSLNAIWLLNLFLTSNELHTSHVCLLIISTQLSQRASMLAQHSQLNDQQREITCAHVFVPFKHTVVTALNNVTNSKATDLHPLQTQLPWLMTKK